MNLNRVLLAGRLTRDIELKQMPGGQMVAQIGIAVNRTYKTKSGEKREEVTFVDCEAWGRTAEVMAEHLHKGEPVFIEGRLKLDIWEDRNTGATKSKLRVAVERFEFVDDRSASKPPATSRAPAGPAGQGHDEPEVPF